MRQTVVDRGALVAAVERLYAEADDLPVTVRQLQAALGISSTSVVQYHVERLASAGLIRWTPGVARSIRPAKEGGVNTPYLKREDLTPAGHVAMEAVVEAAKSALVAFGRLGYWDLPRLHKPPCRCPNCEAWDASRALREALE